MPDLSDGELRDSMQPVCACGLSLDEGGRLLNPKVSEKPKYE
jgi:hypothetical protein